MSKTKALKKAMNEFVTKILARSDFENSLEYQEEVIVYLIQMQEGLNPCSI